MIGTLIVIAKRPVAGRVKTRLIPHVGPVVAAELAAAALSDTLRVVASAPARHRLLAFDGPADDWLPDGWLLAIQPSGGLDDRLGAAFAAAPAGPALLVGMDTPQLRREDLTFDASRYDACLGRADDGGFWAIGFRDPRRAAAVIAGVPMSVPTTAEVQLARLRDSGMRVQLLPTLTDVDVIEDAWTVADAAPASTFSMALRRACSVARVG
jgi:glycosyltransferase A (GT-A) superfamily protein (DUF2064 family)